MSFNVLFEEPIGSDVTVRPLPSLSGTEQSSSWLDVFESKMPGTALVPPVKVDSKRFEEEDFSDLPEMPQVRDPDPDSPLVVDDHFARTGYAPTQRRDEKGILEDRRPGQPSGGPRGSIPSGQGRTAE